MMTQENKDRLLEMIKMRLDGCTYQEIANKYGISRQCVCQAIANFTRREGSARIRKSPLDRCIYPNLRQWMYENKITLVKLNGIIGKSLTNTERTSQKMRGESDFKISEIKAILKESGKTFEYMFSTEKSD